MYLQVWLQIVTNASFLGLNMKLGFILDVVKTSPKGFSASKCDVGNWIFQNLRNFFRNCLEIFLEEFLWQNFLGGIFERNFLRGFYWEDLFLGGLFFGRIVFWEDCFLGGFFWEDFWEDSFGMNSLFTLELTCLSRFWFLSSSLHLKSCHA